MKIKYLGTAAAEGFPAFYCSCEQCERAREAGGKNIRTRSQALINDDLLIDYPADTYMHTLDYGLDLRKVKSLLLTHNHDDHIYPFDITYRKSPMNAIFPDDEKRVPLDIFVSKKSSKDLKKVFRQAKVYKDKNALALYTVKAFEPFITAGNYIVTPMMANHYYSKLESLIYAISKNGKAVLYAHDTGMFHEKTWEFLKNSKLKFNFVSLDCTSTKRKTLRGGHMNLEGCVQTKARLIEIGCADDKTIFCLNHFSHNNGYTYDELVPVAKEKGFMVSYDTMEVEF